MAHVQNNSSSSTRRSLRLLTAERKSTTNESHFEEEDTSVTRPTKSKSFETTNKRRIETESDLNDEHRTSTSRHASTSVRRRRRTNKHSQQETSKRQRQSSSDDNEDEQVESKSKSHQTKRTQRTDTGNLCVRRRTGGRDLNTVVSEPSTSTSNRRSRHYTTKSYIDYLSSTGRSSVPAANSIGTENRSCDSTNTGVISSTNNPLHLFNSSGASTAASYHQNSSSPPPSSSSAQTYSGLVPPASFTSSFLTHTQRQTKQSLQMSTESDTDPDNSPTARDILSAPSSSSASAALFHTLSGRVQHLMSRVGGGSSVNGRLQQYIQGIQSSDPDVKLTTLNELCSLLVMSNEDTLPGFQFRALYPPLRDCLADENDANAEIALTACRALTYLMEALPRSAMQVVEATPIDRKSVV